MKPYFSGQYNYDLPEEDHSYPTVFRLQKEEEAKEAALRNLAEVIAEKIPATIKYEGRHSLDGDMFEGYAYNYTVSYKVMMLSEEDFNTLIERLKFLGKLSDKDLEDAFEGLGANQ